jgi:hypothetical protein
MGYDLTPTERLVTAAIFTRAISNGAWDADVVRKRKFYPLLAKLGIEKCGFHAFRQMSFAPQKQSASAMHVCHLGCDAAFARIIRWP